MNGWRLGEMQAEVGAGHPCSQAVSLALDSTGERQFALGVEFGYRRGMCFPYCCFRVDLGSPGKNWEIIAGRWVRGALEAWETHCTRSGATG